MKLVREVPDFPKPGISFKDITTLLADGPALSEVVKLMAQPFGNSSIRKVLGIEARGFILAAPIALELNCGFVPVRKEGKLPADTLKESYELEYGTNTVEVHRDAIEEGNRVLIVDDVLATGGTMQATCKLAKALGGEIVGLSFLAELSFLSGRDKLPNQRIESVLEFSQ
jgi:adenine phosphoribosyltransferase